MGLVETPSGEILVAQRALNEVNRLVSEGTKRFEEQSYIEAMSSLTALSMVLDPLINYLGRTWVAAAASCSPTPAMEAGTYL